MHRVSLFNNLGQAYFSFIFTTELQTIYYGYKEERKLVNGYCVRYTTIGYSFSVVFSISMKFIK